MLFPALWSVPLNSWGNCGSQAWRVVLTVVGILLPAEALRTSKREMAVATRGENKFPSALLFALFSNNSTSGPFVPVALQDAK